MDATVQLHLPPYQTFEPKTSQFFGFLNGLVYKKLVAEIHLCVLQILSNFHFCTSNVNSCSFIPENLNGTKFVLLYINL